MLNETDEEGGYIAPWYAMLVMYNDGLKRIHDVMKQCRIVCSCSRGMSSYRFYQLRYSFISLIASSRWTRMIEEVYCSSDIFLYCKCTGLKPLPVCHLK